MMAQVEQWRQEDAPRPPPPPLPPASAPEQQPPESPSSPSRAAAIEDDTCHHHPPTTPPMPKYLAPLAIATLGLGFCLGSYLLAVAALQHDWPIATRLPPSLLPYLEPTTLALVGVILREKYHQGVTLGFKWQDAAVGFLGAAAEWADAVLAGFGAALLEAQQRRQLQQQQQQALIERGGLVALLLTARSQAAAAAGAVGRALVWLGRFALHTHHAHDESHSHPPQPPFPLPPWAEEPLRLAVRVVLCFLALHCLRLGRRPLGARRRRRQQQQKQQQQEQEKQAQMTLQQQHLPGAVPAFPLTPVSVTVSAVVSTPTSSSSAWTPRHHRRALGERVLAIFTLAFGFSLGIGILAIDAAQRRGPPGMGMRDREMCPPETIASYPSLSSPGPTLRPPLPPSSEQAFPPDPSVAPTMAPRAWLVEEEAKEGTEGVDGSVELEPEPEARGEELEEEKGGRNSPESLPVVDVVGEQAPEGVEEAVQPAEPELKPQQQQQQQEEEEEEEAAAGASLVPLATEPTEPEQQVEQEEEPPIPSPPVIETPPPSPELEPEPEPKQLLDGEKEDWEEEEPASVIMDLSTALNTHDAATIRAALLHSPYQQQQQEEEWSPLHIAAWEGHDQIVALLLELGKGPAFDPSVPGPGDVTPLMLASKRGHAAVVRALLEDPRALSTMDTEDAEGRTALIEAREQGHPAVLLALVQAGADGLNDRHWADGQALVHAAVEALRDGDDQKKGDAWAALLEWLVGQPHVDVNVRTGGVLTGMTPLQLAAVRRRRRATQILIQDARVRAQHFRMVSKGLVDVTLDAAVKAWLWRNDLAMESPF